jgi:YggT family protein
MALLVTIVATLLQFLGFAIFARAILTWFPIDKDGPIFQVLNGITEPILDPLRKIIPPIGMIDISPMVAMISIFALVQVLTSLAV